MLHSKALSFGSSDPNKLTLNNVKHMCLLFTRGFDEAAGLILLISVCQFCLAGDILQTLLEVKLFCSPLVALSPWCLSPSSHISTAGRRCSPLRMLIPAADRATAGAFICTALPAELLNNSPLMLVLIGVSFRMNKECVEIIKNLRNKVVSLLKGDVYSPCLNQWGFVWCRGKLIVETTLKSVIITSDLGWNIITRLCTPKENEQKHISGANPMWLSVDCCATASQRWS